MANGDPLTTKKAPSLKPVGSGFKLLDGATGVVVGPWADVRTFSRGSVEITGPFEGVVVLQGSNQDEKPEDEYEGAQIGSEILAGPALIDTGMPVRWIRAKVLVYQTGPVSALFHSTT